MDPETIETVALHRYGVIAEAASYDLNLWIAHSPGDAAYLPR
jgi:hypothetical protein